MDCYQKIRQQVKCYLQMAGVMGKNELQEVSSYYVVTLSCLVRFVCCCLISYLRICKDELLEVRVEISLHFLLYFSLRVWLIIFGNKSHFYFLVFLYIWIF